MQSLSIPDLLVLAAAGSYVVGYLIINQVTLRIFVLFGTGFYIAYYALVSSEPLWTAIWTSVALGLANLVGLWLLLAARSRRRLTAEMAQLYDSIADFNELPPGDFRVVMNSGKRRVFTEPTCLVEENNTNGTLYFLLKGQARAEKRGHHFNMPAGIFIGEVSYMLSRPSSATVTVDAGSEVIAWEFKTLRERSRRPRFKLALEAMISRDLSRKVAEAVAPFNGADEALVKSEA